MTDRERLTYTGDHELYLPGTVASRPDLVQPGPPDPAREGKYLDGTTIEVNGDTAALLIARGDFRLADPLPAGAPEEPLAVDEPIPWDRQVALEAAAPTTGTSDEAGTTPKPSAEQTLTQLTSSELDDALADAGLPVWGDDDTKRIRLRQFYSAKATEVGTSTSALSLEAINAAMAEREATTTTTTTTSGS